MTLKERAQSFADGFSDILDADERNEFAESLEHVLYTAIAGERETIALWLEDISDKLTQAPLHLRGPGEVIRGALDGIVVEIRAGRAKKNDS